MRRISKITRSILAQNAGRDFERLTMKLELLRQDPFAFFRGTNPLFLDFLPHAHPLSGTDVVESFGNQQPDQERCKTGADAECDQCGTTYHTANRMQAMRLRLCASRMARVVFI
jgi:hypothetical protein